MQKKRPIGALRPFRLSGSTSRFASLISHVGKKKEALHVAAVDGRKPDTLTGPYSPIFLFFSSSHKSSERMENGNMGERNPITSKISPSLFSSRLVGGIVSLVIPPS